MATSTLDLASVTEFEFECGYPTPETVQRAYDEADLNRAIQTYRFFYPTVSFMGAWKGNLEHGAIPNRVFTLLEGTPDQLVFTANSDTPYAGILLDLSDGPMVIETSAGPLIGTANDLNQRWIMDVGLPGPDKGRGGRYVVLPPTYMSGIPSGFYGARSTTNRVLLLLRALPQPDITPNQLMQATKVYPLDGPTNWKAPTWVTLDTRGADFTPLAWENNLGYWDVLHEVIDSEPPYGPYRAMYGELAELGIAKNKDFAPDRRMRDILTRGAQIGNALMRVQSFADRRPERIVWSDRRWEWAVLRPENGSFDMPNYADIYAREKWFYQAQLASPAMFSRAPGAGSLYWLGLRDGNDAFLDGGKTYKLTVPQPVPAKLFWSVTVYDSETRSEIATGQGHAALRSMYELKDLNGAPTVDLFFGPTAPSGRQQQWIKTVPGQGWFAYFRIYGPEKAAFDGEWKPGDFEEVG